MNLAFKGDVTSVLLVRRLSKVVDSTSPAAKLKLTFSTNAPLKHQLKDWLPSSTTSMCIYQFNCSCGAGYVGPTTRWLSTGIREHHLAWLGKGCSQTNSKVPLLNTLWHTEPLVKIENAFSVCYKVTSKVPQGSQILATLHSGIHRNTHHWTWIVYSRAIYQNPWMLAWHWSLKQNIL